MKPVRVVFWAAYLATSWTWCIGMILPVLLMRDHGWLGFWIFAVPNCLGAAAMGWVIRTRADSRRFTKAHAPAVAAFSLVTILFHGAAMPWALDALHQTAASAWTPALLAAAITAAVAAVLPTERVPALAFAVWTVSLGVLVTSALTGFEPAVATIPAADRPLNAWLLLPVSAFGFALCPYLDATFHRAAVTLNWTDRAGAFTLGFLGLFLIMILFTAVYAAPLGAALFGDAPTLPAPLATALPIHLGMQAGLTLALHAREGRPRSFCRSRWTALTIGSLLAGVALWSLARVIPGYFAGLAPQEILYRLILGAYGLFFPAYVWQLARRTPSSALNSTPNRPNILTRWLVPALAAAPLLTVGFLLREPGWMLPGLLIAVVLPSLGPKPAATLAARQPSL
ncbi:MAG: hypothetical protein AAF108_07735 [Planctomycetota bacterium]